MLTGPSGIAYVSFTCLFVSSTLFGLAQIQTLQQQLRTIKESSKDNEEIDKKLNKIIDTQVEIDRYVKDINSLVSAICLVDLLSFGLMLIALLSLLTIVSIFFISFWLLPMRFHFTSRLKLEQSNSALFSRTSQPTCSKCSPGIGTRTRFAKNQWLSAPQLMNLTSWTLQSR